MFKRPQPDLSLDARINFVANDRLGVLIPRARVQTTGTLTTETRVTRHSNRDTDMLQHSQHSDNWDKYIDNWGTDY